MWIRTNLFGNILTDITGPQNKWLKTTRFSNETIRSTNETYRIGRQTKKTHIQKPSDSTGLEAIRSVVAHSCGADKPTAGAT